GGAGAGVGGGAGAGAGGPGGAARRPASELPVGVPTARRGLTGATPACAAAGPVEDVASGAAVLADAAAAGSALAIPGTGILAKRAPGWVAQKASPSRLAPQAA